MAVTIHPHKGYLNTDFQIYLNGNQELSYKIFSTKDGEEVCISDGIAEPNIPQSLKFKEAGEYVCRFDDGTDIEIFVEDGYKFGGGRLKKAFIFDNCPWAFIVMHDRTYFYNRETKVNYIEPISPDSIAEISEEYVIFSNQNHHERTIYSLNEQRPILNISNILFHNNQAIVWWDDENLKVYSFNDRAIKEIIQPRQYLIDNINNQILYAINDSIFSLRLSDDFEVNEMPRWDSKFCAIIDGKFSVYTSSSNHRTEMQIINHISGELVKSITLDGWLASVNGHELINVEDRKYSIRNFDLSKSDFPEASIMAKYHDYIFYPCEWDIFYLDKTSTYTKSQNHFQSEETIELKDLNTELCQLWVHFEKNEAIITDTRFLLFNQNESFVRSKFYSSAGYNSDGRVRVHNNTIILEGDKCIYTLSRNGYWDNKIVGEFDFDRFALYGILRDKETKIYRSFRYNIKSSDLKFENNPTQHAILGDAAILPGGKVHFKKNELVPFSKVPIAVSPSHTLGIDIDKLSGKVYLLLITASKEEKVEILQNTFDYSDYHNVLLSEDGGHILYRNAHKTEMKDVITGEVIAFDNLSYVEQTNGIRPTFLHSSSLQPRIVNPITGQILDSQLMKKFNFISPNGQYYAGTLKDMYIEHYYIDNGDVIPEDEYKQLIRRLTYPVKEKKETEEWDVVTSHRVEFIKKNFEYINKTYPKLTNCSTDEKRWRSALIDSDNEQGVQLFVNRVIDVRGIAVIKRVSDNSVVAKIDLGKPLSYINYVSFSYNSRYVSLAGYRDFTHGLFLIYDIVKQELLCRISTNRAVWTTAFSSKNAIAAYTSNPNTIFFGGSYECCSEKERTEHILKLRNFLTFSPDGSFIALSNQGYTSKYDINGEERFNWGHQPSTIVDVRTTVETNTSQVIFHDLSDCGIADSSKSQSVASVSFSNDNKKLMMVGNDGVVIVRNLHLEDYATE